MYPRIEWAKPRIIIATLITPMITSIILFVGLLIFESSELQSITELIEPFLNTTIITYPVSFLATIIFIIPLLVLLDRFGQMTLWVVNGSAAFLGSLIPLLFSFVTSALIPSVELLLYISIGAVIAIFMITAFCFISGITYHSNQPQNKKSVYFLITAICLIFYLAFIYNPYPDYEGKTALKNRYEDAYQLWKQVGPSKYRITATQITAFGSETITLEVGNFLYKTINHECTFFNCDSDTSYVKVSKLFERVRREIDSGGIATVEYNHKYGFPSHIYEASRDVMDMDGWITIDVEKFAPL